MMADVGDMYRFGNYSGATEAAAFTNLAGVATDPTAVTLTIQKPDASELFYGWPSAGASGTLVRESAGRFYADVIIDQAGRWRYKLVGTGAVTAAAESVLAVDRSHVA
jgi:hypothetical protein